MSDHSSSPREPGARLRDKVIVITGACGGIGSATATRAAAEGALLVLVDKENSALATLAARIGQDWGIEPAFVAADVSSADDARRYVDVALRAHGRIDGLFNNAGILGTVGPLVSMSAENFDRVFDVNVKGVLFGMQAAIPQMAGRGGAIVNTASTAASRTRPGMSIYGASKATIVSLTRSAAVESEGTGIRVNAVCPGVIDTPMPRNVVRDRAGGDSSSDISLQGLVGAQPIQRPGTTVEVAGLVTWLLSDEASYVTGSAYNIDGGYLA